MKKRNMYFIFLLIPILFVNFTACTPASKGASGESVNEKLQKETGIIEEIRNLKGHIRVIGGEEYALYEEIVRMMEGDHLTEEEIEKETKAYAKRINAIFYLGNRLNLYEPFSLDVLEMRLKQENDKRKEKLEKNEPVYGLQQFETRTFLQYELENLTSDIKLEILSKITREELGDGPKKYFEEHKDEFLLLESVTYEVNDKGNIETYTTDRMGLRSMRNSDPAFLDFINEGKEGDVYRQEGEEITKKIVKMEYTTMEYEEQEENAVIAYMERILFDELVNMVAENNPLEFK